MQAGAINSQTTKSTRPNNKIFKSLQQQGMGNFNIHYNATHEWREGEGRRFAWQATSCREGEVNWHHQLLFDYYASHIYLRVMKPLTTINDHACMHNLHVVSLLGLWKEIKVMWNQGKIACLIFSVWNSNLGFCFFAFKCCVSQLSVYSFGKKFEGVMTLVQVESSPNLCSFGPQRAEKRNIWRWKNKNLNLNSGLC